MGRGFERGVGGCGWSLKGVNVNDELWRTMCMGLDDEARSSFFSFRLTS